MATKSQIEKAWNNAKRIRGKDPSKYRRDPNGREIFRGSYGKRSPKGWEVDHIKPKARGGSDHTVNLQAVTTKINRRNGASLRKRSRHSARNK